MKSQAERSKKTRYLKIPARERTEEQRRFLAAYDAPTQTQYARPSIPRAPDPPVEPEVTAPTQPDADDASGEHDVPLAAAAAPAAHERTPSGPCKPDCAACLGLLGAVTPYHCARTGMDVWPMISDGTARMIAGALLGVIGRLAAWVGLATQYASPTEPEIAMMARAVQAWIRRYVGSAARFDESIAPATIAAAYVGRLSRMPKAAAVAVAA